MRNLGFGLLWLVLVGCGSNLAPQPGFLLRPRPMEVELRHIDGNMWLGWRMSRVVGTEVAEWRLRVEYLVRGCVLCEPKERKIWKVAEELFRELDGVEIAKGGAGMQYRSEGAWRYVLLRDVREYSLQAGVSVKLLNGGFGAETESKLFIGMVDIPRWHLSLKRLGTDAIRLFWQPVDDLIGGVRVNIYGRTEGEDWSLRPLNKEPLTSTQWVWFPVAGDARVAREFTLRLVDNQGNEGPSAKVLRLDLGSRKKKRGS